MGKITYATLSADNEDLHASFEAALHDLQAQLPLTVTAWVDGAPWSRGAPVDLMAPSDTTLRLARVHQASPGLVDEAVVGARRAAGEWAALPWRHRVGLLRTFAEIISQQSAHIAAIMCLEVGKNRLEALGDVEEAAELIRYYCAQFEDHDGFNQPMGQLSPHEHTRSVLRPYGVWGVVSPFNFPMALAAGPAGAALVAGNTVVLKPSLQGSCTASALLECARAAELPPGVLQLLPGGDDIGAALVAHPGLDGLTFTGSYAVGMELYRSFAFQFPKPVICEMGGKNAAIVTASADLELAAEGIARAAFGFTGQKCSACSRVYVERPVAEELIAKIAQFSQRLTVGDPLARATFMGPLIDRAALDRFEHAVTEARRDGEVVFGGMTGADVATQPGFYVAPTLVRNLPSGHRLLVEELFVPFVAVVVVDSLSEALQQANDSIYGLTAGLYAGDNDEVEEFLDAIEAGVVYVNRRAGATTGAWPGVQPFGGWKASGTSGRAAGGPSYVQQFLREQSRTIIDT